MNNVIKSWKQPGKKEKLHVDGSVFKLRELYKFKMGFVHFQLGQNKGKDTPYIFGAEKD